MHKRGGYRPGAGRPSRVPGERRRPLSTTIAHDHWVRLRAYARERGLKLSEALDELLASALPPLPVEPIVPEAANPDA